MMTTGSLEFLVEILTTECSETPSATRNGGCSRPSAILPQPSSVPATAVSALSVVRMSPFVPDFWAQTVFQTLEKRSDRNSNVWSRGALDFSAAVLVKYVRLRAGGSERGGPFGGKT
jgi:hypothetical protein